MLCWIEPCHKNVFVVWLHPKCYLVFMPVEGMERLYLQLQSLQFQNIQLTEDVLGSIHRQFPECKTSSTVFILYSNEMINNILCIWKRNFNLLRLFINLFCFPEVDFQSLRIPKIDVPFKWTQETFTSTILCTWQTIQLMHNPPKGTMRFSSRLCVNRLLMFILTQCMIMFVCSDRFNKTQ